MNIKQLVLKKPLILDYIYANVCIDFSSLFAKKIWSLLYLYIILPLKIVLFIYFTNIIKYFTIMETTIKQVNAASKQANTVFSNAKNDLKNRSAFYYINQLNKMAKKNEYCDHTNVKEAQKRVEAIFDCKGFDANVLHKESMYGTFANLVNIPKETETRKIDLSFQDLVIITTIGRFGNITVNEFERVNETQMLKPIALSENAFLDAYKKRVSEYYKGLKQAIRNANKQAKASK